MITMAITMITMAAITITVITCLTTGDDGRHVRLMYSDADAELKVINIIQCHPPAQGTKVIIMNVTVTNIHN